MKFLHILSLMLVAFVSYTTAQGCQGTPRNPNCAGGINFGHRRGSNCRISRVWSYDGNLRQCRRIGYLGCGGNQNRWCSKDECERKCRR